MYISIDLDVVRLMAAALLVWLLIKFFMLPKARKSLLAKQSSELSGAAVWLSTLTILQSIASAAVVATLLVLAGAAALSWYIGGLPATREAIGQIVGLRDWLERGIDTIQSISSEVWVGSLFVLGLIWLLAARSSSRRRWSSAIEERRKAIEASIANFAPDDIKRFALESDQPTALALEERAGKLLSENRSQVERAINLPVVRFGGEDGPEASIMELQSLVDDLEEKARRAEDGSLAEAEQRSPDELRQIAAGLNAKVDEIKQKFTVEVETFSGASEKPLGVLLAEPDQASIISNEFVGLLRRIVVESKLRSHNAVGLSKARREPELLKEWLTAGASSELTVKTTSFLGRSAAGLALIALFLGMLGLAGRELGPLLAIQAEALEIKFASDIADRDLKSRKIESVENTESISQDDVATDEQTAQALRQAFHSSIARGLGAARGGRVSGRQIYELSAVEARQRILVASAREAAPAYEADAPAHRIAYQGPPSSYDGTRFIQDLDEQLDQRIRTLRENESVWQRLRASAARAPSPDFVSRQFIHTVLAYHPFADSHAMRVYVQDASGRFALAAAQNGAVPHAFEVGDFASHSSSLSLRDRRLVADYEAHVPQRISSVLDDYHSGRIDPGSIHRVVPGVNQTAFNELFASSAESATGGGGGGGGGDGKKSSKSSSTRVAARSYSRMRFSGRIGGVLIGLEPDGGSAEINVTGFDWRIEADRARLTVTTGDGEIVELGSFVPAIVHHAMAYAADGRVITSTLPQPQPPRQNSPEAYIDARRVLVHPAFEDTAFACSAIEVDRFVDAFTAGNSEEQMTEVGQVRRYVTYFGELLRISAVSKMINDEKDREVLAQRLDEYSKELAPYVRSCGTGNDCLPLETYEKLGFDFGNARTYLNCLAANDNHVECKSDLHSLDSPTMYLVDSGVRESSYRIDESFAFLRRDAHNSDALWPLDFMIQAVPQDSAGNDATGIEEATPWEFPSIRSKIREDVAAGVSQITGAQQILEHMREFVVLQRVFRLALNGSLGEQFPLHKLPELQERTAKYVKVVRSDRWNRNEAFYRALITEQSAWLQIAELLQKDSLASEECKSEAQALAQAGTLPLSSDFWGSLGKLADQCRSAQGGDFVRERVASLKRQDVIDEAIAFARSTGSGAERKPFSCGPL